MTSISNPLTNAQSAVFLSYVAYAADASKDISTYLPGWKVVWNGTQTYDGNYAFIAVDPTGEIYGLAIRGSLNPEEIFKNWDAFANWILEDLDVITQVNWPYANTSDALIASGTNTAFTNVQTMQDTMGSGLSIADYLIANVIKAGKQVIITGHSLGANIANVYTSYFVTTVTQQNLSTSNISLYTFAAPAAGNAAFAKDLDTKLPAAWHYQNSNDIIPNFPVSQTIIKTAFLYQPKPDASAVTVSYNGYTVSLREGFILLAGVFLFYGYQQQSNNYTTFYTALDPAYENNTAADWFGQAASQHHLNNYGAFLGVNVPKGASAAETV